MTAMPTFPQKPNLFPIPETTGGDLRRTGVEVEFAGISEQKTADLLHQEFGGEIKETGPHRLVIEGTELGDFRVELDTKLTKFGPGTLHDQAMQLIRGLVPVEVITDPLTPEGLARFDTIMERLRDAGAFGSRRGMLLGFGVHLNPAIVGVSHPHTLRAVRAYALLDPYLRGQYSIDTTRRILPFVRAWPDPFVSLLARHKPADFAALIDLSDPYIRSRNHALDLLPLLKWAAPKLYDATFPSERSTSARPAFHFRLPDSRVDEADWSLSEAWAMWGHVEQLAADPETLERLEDAWLTHAQNGGGSNDARWVAHVAQVTRSVDA